MQNLISLSPPVSRYWANLRRGYFQFPNFGQSFIDKICHNSRISLNTDMKLGPVAKLNKTNMATSKNFLRYCHASKLLRPYNFSNCGQFEATRKLDSGSMVCKTYIFINNNLYITKI